MEQQITGNKCIVKLRLPPEYLVTDASADRKATSDMYEKIAKEISDTGHGVIVFPCFADDNGNQMFDIEVIKV